MKRKWSAAGISVIPFDIEQLGDVRELSNAELKLKIEQGGYVFTKKFQTKAQFVHRQIAGGDVLISVGENIANFNGYIEINSSASFLWEEMKEPRTANQLEQALERKYHLSHEQAVEDVLDFLQILQEHDMVLVSS